MPAALRVEDRGGVRTLTLSHPARKNALDEGVIESLRQAVEGAEAAGARALLVRGEGDEAFCAGYDLHALAAVGPSGELPDDALEEALSALAACPVPSIALVHGPAFGAGCDLACACDLRVGSATATFCMPPARLGVIYAASGLSRVQALVGPARAKRMFFTALKVDAARAQDWGLLDELHPTVAEADAAASSWAETIASMAPLAIRGMKRTFAAIAGARLDAVEVSALRQLRREAFSSADAREGRAAFLEKRAPKFTGR